jgi:pimeloyl-ACP methyl ester carboxylesterase
MDAPSPSPTRAPALHLARSFFSLLRWLGPWGDGRVPTSVKRDETRLRGNIRAYVYSGRRRPVGAYLVAPGLHPQGPDDPRLDRFLRILATSGFLVVAPCLPTLIDLRVSADSADHLATAFDEAERLSRDETLPKPAIFSISFGSWPAITLASRAELADRIGALVLFGGYADFPEAIRFAVTGCLPGVELPYDPLNVPAVFLNVVPHLGLGERLRPLEAALREMVERTWGREEMKLAGARDPIARSIAERLEAEVKELFLMGCGLAPGGPELVDRVLEDHAEAFAFADPRPSLAKVRAKVVVVHGRTDDVIPYTHAEQIRRSLPPDHPVQVFVTGMYGHTGGQIPPVRAMAKEASTLLQVAAALVRAPTGML